VCKGFVKAQITILATAILCGCGRVSVPIGTDPVSIPNTITPVPSAISSSTPEDVVLLRTSSGHSKRVLDVAFSARGEFLGSSSQDMSIKLWDVRSEQEVHACRMRSVDMSDTDREFGGNFSALAEAIWDLAAWRRSMFLNW
jgi:WD40 repeat protein